MRLVLQLVERGADTPGRKVDLLEIDQPRDIADLGLTLSEVKQLLARVQQAVVAAQARDHASLRPECSSCGARCHVKDWQSRQIATLFGTVAVRQPRLWSQRDGRELALALSFNARAGPSAGAPVRAVDLPRGCWRPGPPAAGRGRDEP